MNTTGLDDLDHHVSALDLDAAKYDVSMSKRREVVDDNIIVTKSMFDDFSIPTPSRNFEVIVENQPLYLNAGWLAELSPWFAAYCFGEDARSRLHVDDITFNDMLEFFRFSNVSLVLRCATRFDMRPVMARCERFVAVNAPTLDRTKLFQVTCAMSKCDPNSSTMSVLVDRLASIKEHDLSDMQFDKMPGHVVADVYREKIRRKHEATQKWFCPLNWISAIRRSSTSNRP